MSKILVIDDEEQIRVVFKEMLARLGYEVLEAATGEDGLALQREKAADLVITDIIMPHKEGLETIRELRQEFPEVKIIAMSGGGRIGSDRYLNLAKQFGAMCTLQKPIRMEQLRQEVHRLLK
ncbi:MAG: response regulator [Deltaproteobacteria bacterium]